MMLRIIVTLTLVLSHQGRGDLVGCLSCCHPTLQIPRFARNDTVAGLCCFTLTFDSSPIKETFAKPTVIPA